MKTAWLIVCCGALLAGVAAADSIIFNDDLELSGDKVEVVREHDRGVDVRVSHGTITIPWDRIKSIRIDYAAHLAAMQADRRDTPRGLMDFMHVLLRHAMPSEAAEVAGLILAKDKVAEDILLDVGSRMESEKQWALAKTAFEAFLRVNPSRRDIALRLDEVEKHVPATEPPKDGVAVQPPDDAVKPPDDAVKPPDDAVKPPDDPVEPPKAPAVVEGLEAEADWVAEAWGNPAEVEVVTQGAEVKNKVLSVSYRGIEKDKTAVRLGGTWDLTQHEYLVFDVWNASERSVGLSVAFNTMPGWKFFESTSHSIRPKAWVTIKISLSRARFKCEESQWRNTSELKNRDHVKQIILMLYNTSKEGIVYFDNIRLAGPGDAPVK